MNLLLFSEASTFDIILSATRYILIAFVVRNGTKKRELEKCSNVLCVQGQKEVSFFSPSFILECQKKEDGHLEQNKCTNIRMNKMTKMEVRWRTILGAIFHNQKLRCRQHNYFMNTIKMQCHSYLFNIYIRVSFQSQRGTLKKKTWWQIAPNAKIVLFI